ncbi:hypothetical protein [Pontibacillus salipaludis]|uniref:hypothetical protein n=1 Tax=Pontibacillus salipaludis TaxID=1697394 RepID=UPI0031E50158
MKKSWWIQKGILLIVFIGIGSFYWDDKDAFVLFLLVFLGFDAMIESFYYFSRKKYRDAMIQLIFVALVLFILTIL